MDRSFTNTPEPENGNEILVVRTKAPDSHGQAPLPPCPQRQAAEAGECGPGRWHRQAPLQAGEQAGARDTSGVQSGHQVQMAEPAPGCPVGAACPAFLVVTFSRRIWQLRTRLPRDILVSPFSLHLPLPPPQARLLPTATSSDSRGMFCHLNNLLPFIQFPSAKPVCFLALLWSFWAAAVT